MLTYFFDNEYEIRAYECDVQGRLHPLALFNFMQDMASRHADMLGFSVQKLMKKNMTWVLSRIHLQILKTLYWGDVIKGRTWPSGRQGRYALRDFRLTNDSGETVALATTSWMVLDLEKRVPLKLENLGNTDYFLQEERALQDEFSSLPLAESYEYEKSFRVRYSDLDINRHVNHVSYIDWGLEAVPDEVLLKSYPADIEVSYRKEVFYNDRIISRCHRVDDEDSKTFIHQLFIEGGEEIGRLCTSWRGVI
ncbi:MAG: hypothetical protein EH225_12675 [Calditrichaeota bacterium]|nr:hypothetical protein [Calditrichota bacterium]RQV98782.1 MAG: hypothetical protein EH225_12675 [Calditrichota bacterium]